MSPPRNDDGIEALFPEGHPLARLVLPTFDRIRATLDDRFVATVWVDATEDPTRAGFRPSYDSVHGPGSSTMMPFVAAWLSSGPQPRGASNVVLFPDVMDATLVDYARDVGILGEHAWVKGVRGMMEHVERDPRRRKLYNIDDLDPAFDSHAVVSAALSRWVNSKEDLASLTRFCPREIVTDMYEATADHYREIAGERGGRVFLKTCNTENAGRGVYIANDRAEMEAQLTLIRETQRAHGLSRRLVLQPEIVGTNKSFQVLLDPRDGGRVQVIALSDQIVEPDGKTYRSSINHPITKDTVAPVGEAILDMVDRIWARFPDAFGFLMSDYFQTASGPVIYDPGIRPTGNTATAMAAHLARSLTGRFFATSLVPLPTNNPGLPWTGFVKKQPGLFSPESLVKEGRAVMPWGWNRIQGFGMLVAIAETEEALPSVRAELERLCT